MIRVLYVDSDTDAIKRIYTDWHNDEIQLEDVACSGDEAIAFLKQKDYDIMVLDLVLKGIDGFAVLTVAEKLCKSTRVIILTAAMNAGLLNLALSIGANYVMLKPCGMDPLANIIKQVKNGLFDHTMIGAGEEGLKVGNALERVVTKMLFQIGLNPKLKGFHLAREAIIENLKLAQNGERHIGVIYKILAERHNMRYICVERNIRNAIETAWMEGNTVFINQLFGYSVQKERGKPTNGEFISLLSDRIMMTSEKQA